MKFHRLAAEIVSKAQIDGAPAATFDIDGTPRAKGPTQLRSTLPAAPATPSPVDQGYDNPLGPSQLDDILRGEFPSESEGPLLLQPAEQTIRLPPDAPAAPRQTRPPLTTPGPYRQGQAAPHGEPPNSDTVSGSPLPLSGDVNSAFEAELKKARAAIPASPPPPRNGPYSGDGPPPATLSKDGQRNTLPAAPATPSPGAPSAPQLFPPGMGGMNTTRNLDEIQRYHADDLRRINDETVKEINSPE